LASKVGHGVDALLGQASVHVEGVPGHGEGILVAARDGGLVEVDGLFKAALAYVALILLALGGRK
jgi:hypothetical protein